MTDQITEKVYCYDHPSAYNNNGWEMAALMNNGNNQWMNNPFAYMMMLALFGMWGGGFGFGNRGDFCG